MEGICIAALCCSSISFTITFTSLFKSLREWIGSFHPKLDELMHCPWCFNHYIVLLYMLTVPKWDGIVATIVWYFAIIALSGVIHYVLIRAYEPIAKLEVLRKITKNNKHE